MASRDGRGIYLAIYPAVLPVAPRMAKVSGSIHGTGHFAETQLVSVAAPDLPVREELAPGVHMTRVAGSTRRGNVGRVLRGAMWIPRVYLRFRRANLALVGAHNVWVLPLCWLLARGAGAPLIYNAHELETETTSTIGPKQRVAKRIEAFFIRRCAVVSVVNEPIAEWYESTYRISRPVTVANVPVFEEAEVGFRERLGVTADEMLYVHTGHLTGGRNIPLMLEAFSRSPHHVAFLGDGALRAEVEAAARAHSNIHWVAPVKPELLIAHVREADVGLCLIDVQNSLSHRLSTPNKLMEALAAGIPALCTDLVEARRHLGEAADDWILLEPEFMLGAALERITKEDCERFKTSWQGVPTWDAEVAHLVTAVNDVMTAVRR